MGSSKNDLLAIHLNKKEVLVHRPSEILYCLAEGSYVNLHLKNGSKILIGRTLGEIQKILEPHDFVRIHKSHLVNIHEVIVYQNGSNNTVTMSNQEELMVAKDKKDRLFETFVTL